MPDLGDAGVVLGDQYHLPGDRAIGKIVNNHQPPPPPPPVRTVLMLLSNPVDTPNIRLDEEFRAVDRAIRSARHRDQIDLRTGMALRAPDLQDLLLWHSPAIVHYAGHSNHDGIALADRNGRATAVKPAAIENLFAILKDTVTCVVLNSCLSDRQARSIAKHVPCVVGLSNRIGDPVAIAFAAGFHQGIASGRSIGDAFDLGRNRPELQGLNNDGPRLFCRNDTDARLTITR